MSEADNEFRELAEKLNVKLGVQFILREDPEFLYCIMEDGIYRYPKVHNATKLSVASFTQNFPKGASVISYLMSIPCVGKNPIEEVKEHE